MRWFWEEIGREEGLNMITKYYKEISTNKIILNKKIHVKTFLCAWERDSYHRG